MSLIFDYPIALAGVTLTMLDGNKKYGRGNFKKGMPQGEIIDSLLRHIAALQGGEIYVPDSEHGATHWDAIMSNAMMLSELRPVQAIEMAPNAAITNADPLWGSMGVDTSGFCLVTGFDSFGWHRTHNNDDPLCNCPSCR